MKDQEDCIPSNVSQYNYLAIQLLEYLGNKNPTQEQIDIVEELLSIVTVKQCVTFDDVLNKTETACLFWVSRGKSSNEIADLLNMTQSNVKMMRKEIKRKLSCSNMAQAVFQGLRFGTVA